jgi:hypothetical protein
VVRNRIHPGHLLDYVISLGLQSTLAADTDHFPARIGPIAIPMRGAQGTVLLNEFGVATADLRQKNARSRQ